MAEPAANATARQVTYAVNIEVDRKALRAQVFNEGWRIMKNRFYDAKMHGADWAAAKTTYEPLLDYLVDDEELNTVMMMMIGELNASHTGVSGGGRPDDDRPALQTRHPGFDLVADPSGYYKVGHIYKDGPADRDYLKIKRGDFLIAVDDHELKQPDNYWQYFTLAPGSKFHFLVNDKPARDGAWALTISPVAGSAFSDLQYARWVDDRRDMVTKLSNGDIGYLHIRAMDAPSLRQFQLDLAAQRTKKALVIDQRFNGGGGIDQELLAILAGRQYQYTVGRDAGFQQPRPQNFYGPMVVMQNERSASDAEMFPAGFKALGLGKVVGVPTMGAVIGTGSYTLLNGATIRTPGSGVWTVAGQNMENYGVPPDVLIDNTPADFIKGRDAQIEKAVEILKADMGRKTVDLTAVGLLRGRGRRAWRLIGRRSIPDRRHAPQVGEDGFQIVVAHLAVPRPRHRRLNRARLAHVLAGAQRLHEHLLVPAAETRIDIGRQVHRERDAPRSRKRGIRCRSRPGKRRREGRRRRDAHGLRVPGQHARHIRLRPVCAHLEGRVAISARAYGREITAALDRSWRRRRRLDRLGRRMRSAGGGQGYRGEARGNPSERTGRHIG